MSGRGVVSAGIKGVQDSRCLTLVEEGKKTGEDVEAIEAGVSDGERTRGLHESDGKFSKVSEGHLPSLRREKEMISVIDVENDGDYGEETCRIDSFDVVSTNIFNYTDFRYWRMK